MDVQGAAELAIVARHLRERFNPEASGGAGQDDPVAAIDPGSVTDDATADVEPVAAAGGAASGPPWWLNDIRYAPEPDDQTLAQTVRDLTATEDDLTHRTVASLIADGNHRTTADLDRLTDALRNGQFDQLTPDERNRLYQLPNLPRADAAERYGRPQ